MGIKVCEALDERYAEACALCEKSILKFMVKSPRGVHFVISTENIATI